MRICLAAATAAELGSLPDLLGCTGLERHRPALCAHAGHDLHLIVTGVGMVATAAWCSQAFTRTRYDLALNVGVCGSFDPALRPGSVVHVVSDRLAELGAEDGTDFLGIEELGLLEADDRPFSRAEIRNPAPPDNAALAALPRVSAITVNTVHGREASIAAIVRRFNPQVESMEGAAFMYACLMHGIPFAQVRAVSNMVEKRNRAAWRLPEAIAALEAAARSIIESS